MIRNDNPSIVFFDTEDDSKGGFVLGVTWSLLDASPKVHRDKDSMRKEICGHKVAVAHNAMYDVGNLFSFDEVDVYWAGGVFVKAVVRKTGTTIRDSFRLLPSSIKTIGDSIGLPKLSMDDGLADYCIRDVEIMMRAMLGMFDLALEMGVKPSWTLAGMAYRIWRKGYSGPPLTLPSEFEEPARQAYFGGRVECFRIGKIDGRVFIYDVNSMYPYAMLRPIPKWDELKERSVWNGEPGLVEAEVESDLDIPVLPYRRKDGLCFPNGRFNGVWSSEELKRFEQEGGKIRKVVKAWTSSRTVSGIFRDYVEMFFRMKKIEKDQFRRLVWKMLLNSLYGRFGIKSRMQMLRKFDGENDALNATIIETKTGLYRVVEIGGRPEFSNALIAGTITANARLRLYDGLKAAGEDVIYCDTDSMVTTSDMSGRIPVGDGLGEWGLEMSADGAEIVAPKVYRVGGKVRAKGFKVKTAADFETLARERRFEEERPVKWRTAMRFGERINLWKKFEKRLTSEYRKRILLDDGTTVPVVLVGQKL